MEHTCGENGAPVRERVGEMEWPPYASPGEVVRVTGVNRWGRVDLLHKCCGTIQVAFCQGDTVVTVPLTLGDVSSVWGGADYPANVPPTGYRIPAVWPRV